MKNIPTIVNKLNGTNARGPNCWNATLLFHGVTNNVEFTPDYAILAWLNVDCRKIDGRCLKFGDVLVMKRGSELIHTAVYLKRGMYWHKPGCNGSVGWEFASKKRIKDIYSEADTLYYMRPKNGTKVA